MERSFRTIRVKERTMQFVKFMTSPMGRVARIILGAVILIVGQLVVKGVAGNIMSVVGLVPMSGGLFDFCLIGYALGYPLSGTQARKKLAGG
jgi:hypothetical protein